MGSTATMTGDELLRHRLAELEEWRVESSATIRATERDVDIQKIEAATVKGLLIELRTECRERDEYYRSSLARLHERLDDVIRDDTREQGREQGRAEASTRTWKVIASTVMAVIAFGALVVAVLTLAGVG
jgi:hypothetical protein